jgi:hypothetical protein
MNLLKFPSVKVSGILYVGVKGISSGRLYQKIRAGYKFICSAKTVL